MTIAYLYDPFRGAEFDLLIDHLGRLVERRGYGLRIVYVNPVEHQRLLARPGVVEFPQPSAWRLWLAGVPRNGARTYQIWPWTIAPRIGSL